MNPWRDWRAHTLSVLGLPEPPKRGRLTRQNRAMDLLIGILCILNGILALGNRVAMSQPRRTRLVAGAGLIVVGLGFIVGRFLNK